MRSAAADRLCAVVFGLLRRPSAEGGERLLVGEEGGGEWGRGVRLVFTVRLVVERPIDEIAHGDCPRVQTRSDLERIERDMSFNQYYK